LGLGETIIFFNNSDRFESRVPEGLIDTASGVVCCPNNFEGHEDMAEGVVRVTSLANYDRWAELDQMEYENQKRRCYDRAISEVVRLVPDFRSRVTYVDMFTPCTIHKYTGHVQGGVYGAPSKQRDGRTFLENLYLCGTDQGYLGIIGALLSGITISNLQVLSKT
jgi:phytoene dehydrogenase-like protein